MDYNLLLRVTALPILSPLDGNDRHCNSNSENWVLIALNSISV